MEGKSLLDETFSDFEEESTDSEISVEQEQVESEKDSDHEEQTKNDESGKQDKQLSEDTCSNSHGNTSLKKEILTSEKSEADADQISTSDKLPLSIQPSPAVYISVNRKPEIQVKNSSLAFQNQCI